MSKMIQGLGPRLTGLGIDLPASYAEGTAKLGWKADLIDTAPLVVAVLEAKTEQAYSDAVRALATAEATNLTYSNENATALFAAVDTFKSDTFAGFHADAPGLLGQVEDLFEPVADELTDAYRKLPPGVTELTIADVTPETVEAKIAAEKAASRLKTIIGVFADLHQIVYGGSWRPLAALNNTYGSVRAAVALGDYDSDEPGRAANRAALQIQEYALGARKDILNPVQPFGSIIDHGGSLVLRNEEQTEAYHDRIFA